MSYQFVTNNPRLIDKEGAIPVDGTFRDVLVKVRDMVHAGYELISHPLFASSRMMFSPYRTILMGGKLDAPRVEFIEIIENSILSYDNAMARRRRQPEHDDDYAYVDESLFYSALEEIELTDWKTDKDFVYDVIDKTGVVLVHGSGFCEEFGQGHFRSILLPPMPVLEEAYDLLEKFMVKHQ